MCGENRSPRAAKGKIRGSPPRMRGKQRTLPSLRGCPWDHPRVCGENFRKSLITSMRTGSPPRVRGKLLCLPIVRTSPRITPACAGKTRRQSAGCCHRPDHPRVCGENFPERQKSHSRRGSPPRVRGKHIVFNSANHLVGITPACAGKTSDFQQCIF